jgi:hypothetical protein
MINKIVDALSAADVNKSGKEKFFEVSRALLFLIAFFPFFKNF